MKYPDPLVSVVIPAYNADCTLEASSKSALASTHQRIEVIVVDDGSTDGTRALVERLIAADSRVRLVQRPNGGLPVALNTGIRSARGDFVARLDADDLWHPTKLAKQVTLARAHPGTPFIYSFYRYIDDDGRVLFDGPPQRFSASALCRSIYETLIGTGSSVLMDRRAVLAMGGFDTDLRNSEDLVFQARAAASFPIAFVPEYLVGYRVRSRSLSQDVIAMRDSWFQIHRRFADWFPQVPAYVHRWGHARRCMSMAESLALRKGYTSALRLVAIAVRQDPTWSLAFLSWRLGRTLSVRRERGPNTRSSRAFLKYDPTRPSCEEDEIYGAQGAMLRRLHQSRISRLNDLDRKLAHPTGF
jgi:glycosyltransferase involved in cell wall biosynthesis